MIVYLYQLLLILKSEIFINFKWNFIGKQECIPVGCVPSAAVDVCGGAVCRGCLPRHTPWADTSLGRHFPGQTLPWADTPLGRHPQVDNYPGQTPPWADTPSHTPQLPPWFGPRHPLPTSWPYPSTSPLVWT